MSGNFRMITMDVAVDAAGNAAFTSPAMRGWVESIQYIKDGGAPAYAAGVDFTITDKVTGESLWTQLNVDASAIVRPRAALHDTVGGARLYAAGGTAVTDKIAINGPILITIANGGVSKTGKFRVICSN